MSQKCKPDVPKGSKPDHKRQQVVVFLLTYSGYLLLYSTRKPFSVVKADLQWDLSLSTHWLGAIDTAFLFSYAFGQFALPGLGDSLGVNVAACLAFVGSGVCALGFGLAYQPLVLTSFWLLNGVFQAPVFPLLIRAVGLTWPETMRGQIMGVWTTSQQVGSMVATAFSAFVAEAISWRAAFVCPSVVVGLFGFVLLTFLPKLDNETEPVSSSHMPGTAVERRSHEETEAIEMYDMVGNTVTPRNKADVDHEHQDCNSTPTVRNEETVAAPSLWEIFRIPHILSVSFAYFFVKLVRYSLLFWLPFFLSKQLGYSPTEAGYSSIMFDVGGVGGAVFTGFVSDYLMNGKRLALAGLMCGATAVSLTLFSWVAPSGLVPMLFSMGLLGFSVAGPDSVLGAAAAQDLCQRAGLHESGISKSAGVINGFGSVGAILQGYMTAHIALHKGWDFLFSTLCLFSTFGALLLVRPTIAENRRQ